MPAPGLPARALAVAALTVVLATTACAPATPPAVVTPTPQACAPGTAILGWSDALEGGLVADRDGTVQTVGNLSALAALPGGEVLALSDRSVLITLDPTATRALTAETLRGPSGGPLDSESLVVDADGTLLVGDETGPAVLRYTRDGRLLESLPVAGEVTERAQVNVGFEGLALLPDARTLVAGLEGPLAGDDPGRTRLDTWTRPAVGTPFVPGPGTTVPLAPGLGLTELVALDDGRLLALLRGYDEEVGNTVLLALLDGGRTTVLADLGDCPPLGATARGPQRNPLLDNVEGMTITRRGPDRTIDLLLVSDDNDSAEQVTRTYRLRVAVPGP